MIVVFPAPVGPTMAVSRPAGASRLRSCSTVFSGSYPKDTCFRLTSPRTGGSGRAPGASGSSSASFSSANTRSDAASAENSSLTTSATALIGPANFRLYSTKEETRPRSMAPRRYSIPPSSAIRLSPRLLMAVIVGPMVTP